MTLSLRRGLAGAAVVFASFRPALALDLKVSSPEAANALVGRMLTITASSADPGPLFYRFRVRRPGGSYQMIRDFGPLAALDWAGDREGPYQLEVAVQDVQTGEIATRTRTITVGTRVAAGQPVVNPTSHPLVFLFSAPACAAGERMRVRFQRAVGPPQQTPYRACESGLSMNFYLAGLYPETAYTAWAQLDTGDAITEGAPVSFESGTLPPVSWKQTVVQAPPANSTQNLLLGTSGGSQVATDLAGAVVWYNPSPVTYATTFEAGGFLWGFLEDATQPIEQQGIRKVDLTGRTILETNAARINQQLAALGKPPIAGFHHEVRTLPSGRIVALAVVEKLVTDQQGPGTVDVLGDVVLVLDANLQVVWSWNAFDYLDVTRKSTTNDSCTPGGGGCPPFSLAPTANDWTHGNAVVPTADGNLVYSARHQDWLIKISYEEGNGDGHIIWKLGKDGDFTYTGSDPFPWFSHQHDANFEAPNRLTVFDNGNVRVAANGGNSRGQVIELDEQRRTATLRLNADLGVYSIAVGSAQRLRNGNHHFDAGYVPIPGGITAYALEVDRTGQVVTSLMANTMLYRSMRLTDLYSAN